MNFFTLNDLVFLPLLVAFLIAVITTPLAIFFAKRYGILDDPSVHKHPGIIHTKPIPRGGGIPLFLGVLGAGLLFLPHGNLAFSLYLAAGIALVVGLIDDKYDISPYVRFLTNILCAVIVVASGISIPFITHPLTGGILHFDTIQIQLFFPPYSISLASIIAGIWIIWVMNMLNWSKGVDGQMPGIVAISALVIGILSLRFPILDQSSIFDAKLSFILAGASLGFLIFNFHPAKIFPGYGATAIYLLLAVVSMHSSAKLATAILVMGVPTVDALFTIARRVASGKSPFWYDNKHLHHILLRLGYRQRQIALFYWCISAILGTISLTIASRSKVFAIIMLLVIVGGALLFLHLVVRDRHEKITS
jgi:UDP-GlcNAc:undecaprenyl-phosphate GlcNAc-1-phosphate transferase